MEGKTVRVLGVTVEVPPETMQSFEEHKHDKHPAMWQHWGPRTWTTPITSFIARWFMRTVAKKAGYPGTFD
jgi:hypothetical protein